MTDIDRRVRWMETSDRIASTYGVDETNPLWTSEVTHETVNWDERCTLGDPRLERVVRLRLLTEPGYPMYDISYCYGILKDGTHVRLDGVPMHLSKARPKADLIAWAREEGVNAKALGLLDPNNWSILR